VLAKIVLSVTKNALVTSLGTYGSTPEGPIPTPIAKYSFLRFEAPPTIVLKSVALKIDTTTKGTTIYVRAIKIERDGEQHGTYYQAVRSDREGGKVKQEVVHLGEHGTAVSALAAWPQKIRELGRLGRPKEARNLQRKLDRLKELTEGGRRVNLCVS